MYHGLNGKVRAYNMEWPHYHSHYLQNYRSHHVSLKQELQRQRIALAANKPSQTTPGKVVKKQRVVPEVAQAVGMTPQNLFKEQGL